LSSHGCPPDNSTTDLPSNTSPNGRETTDRIIVVLRRQWAIEKISKQSSPHPLLPLTTQIKPVAFLDYQQKTTIKGN
jgi:hypothetical protein